MSLTRRAVKPVSGEEPVSLVNLGEKDELRMTEQTKNAKTAYAISKQE
jgi:hypothetical protein